MKTSTEATTQLRNELEHRLARHGVALTNADIATALSLYSDDAIVRPANTEPVRGKENLSVFFNHLFSAVKISRPHYATEELESHDGTAIHIGSYQVTLERPGSAPIADRGSFTIIWRRQDDGSWRYHRGIFNSSLPAAQARSLATNSPQVGSESAG